MKKISKLILVLALMLVGWVPAFADKGAPIPKEVFDKIRSLEAECRAVPTKPEQVKISPDVVQKIVQRVDLNGDGLADFVFSDADVNCEVAPHGNGGIGIVVFIGTLKGAKEAYSNTIGDFRIERKDTGARVVLIVGGGYCGQENFTRATAIMCERDLIWDSKKQIFDMGPIMNPHPQVWLK